MQTYYQRHRTIQAFQFDGTWRQIYDEVPIIVDVAYMGRDQQCPSMAIKQDNHLVYTHFNAENRLINGLCIRINWWPSRNLKVPHRKTYWKSMYNCNTWKDLKAQLPNGTPISYKYEYNYTMLWDGDYIVIYDKIIYDKIQNEYQLQTRLKIVRRRDFESHWSPVPIKPMNHRSR